MDLSHPPYPFRPNAVDEILAGQVIEHLSNIPAVMDGLHAILKVGGRLRIIVPHFSAFGAMAHYDHKTTFHYNSFAWCDINGNKTDMLHDAHLWHMRRRHLIFNNWPGWLSHHVFSPIFNAHKNLYTTTGLAFLIPAVLIAFDLEKPSPQEEAQARERTLGLARSKRAARHQA